MQQVGAKERKGLVRRAQETVDSVSATTGPLEAITTAGGNPDPILHRVRVDRSILFNADRAALPTHIEDDKPSRCGLQIRHY
ncbi:MAG TPA: hypothetical protein VFM35_09535 [Candidatus Binatia bacterium]|nr:hypothetical protein [Candidatus Binatia bacterium]